MVTSVVWTLEMGTLGIGTLNMKTKWMGMIPHNNWNVTVDDVRGRMLGTMTSGVLTL